LTRSHTKLPTTIRQRRAIIVHITKVAATAIAVDLGPLPLNTPVIEGFEKGHDLVFFLEIEFGSVDGGEGQGVLVAGLEVEVRWEELGGVEVEVCPAFAAVVD